MRVRETDAVGDAAAVIAAAGRGARFGGPRPKVFVPLGGQPLLEWSLRAYEGCQCIGAVVLVVPSDFVESARRLVADGGHRCVHAIVPGGDRRPASVRAGLEALRAVGPDLVCVHDGARPLVSCEVIERSIEVAREHGAAVAAVPATDTIKRCSPDGRIEDTPPRRELYHAQTPQTFRYELLVEAYQRAAAEGADVTDDASLVERIGQAVYVSEGDVDNFKITTPEDLARAEWVLRRRQGLQAPVMRVGTGYDVHAFAAGRALVLGGVTIDYERGLAGHSDADVLFHAISDALLGAAALGDIGGHFPDTDPGYAGADSAQLAGQVVDLLAEAGWRPANVDATVICQAPRLAPYIAAMRENIARALALPAADVSVKATTTERLGFEGRGEGIAAQATVLICPV